MRHERQLLEALDPRRLHLIVLPTEQCNFRCVYCYEDFAIGRMAPATVRAIKSLIDSRIDELSDLLISWFGGEPLLAYDIVVEIMSLIRDRARPGLNSFSDITTNAARLTPERLENLISLGVTNYQVSLDGLAASHDKKRVLANGAGTFDRVWGNLCKARDVDGDFSMTVRSHVDRDNLAEMPEYIKVFAETFGDDPRFTLYLRQVSRLGGPNDALLPVLAGDSDAMERLREMARGYGLTLFSLDRDEYVCYAAKPNSFVIRANGQIGKCTVGFASAKNKIGTLRDDGTLDLDNAKIRHWARGFESGVQGQLLCPATAAMSESLQAAIATG